MTHLSLIRFGTYALLIFAALTAERQRYVIPVPLAFAHGPDAVDWFGDYKPNQLSKPQDGRLWFGDTVFSGSAVLSLAEEEVKKAGIPLKELESPKIGLDSGGEVLRWRVSFEVKRSLGDGTVQVIVWIEDKNGKVKLERYRHWVGR